MSMRFTAAINKPGFNPLGPQTVGYNYNLFGWGRNKNGILGLGNITTYSSPKQIGVLTTWSAMAMGAGSSYSVKTDGTLWSWGSNQFGKLGLGNTTYYSSPKQVGALTNWSKVGAGAHHVLAIKTDGTLWAWGRNTTGQLGFGNITDYSSPKQVGALTNWLTVCGVYSGTIAVKTDGTLWTWGQGTNGALGLGNTTNYSSPKQVGALTNWLTISAGNYFVASVKTDGTLWTWGENSFGQLGLGTSGAGTYKSSPTQVGALSTWSVTSCGASFVLASTTAGALWAWGFGATGCLGQVSNYSNFSSPKQIGALTNWTSKLVTCASGSSLAIKSDGTLWSWGKNNYGQLAQSNTNDISSPKQVGSVTTWGALPYTNFSDSVLARG